jgi:hypothetical protein
VADELGHERALGVDAAELGPEAEAGDGVRAVRLEHRRLREGAGGLRFGVGDLPLEPDEFLGAPGEALQDEGLAQAQRGGELAGGVGAVAGRQGGGVGEHGVGRDGDGDDLAAGVEEGAADAGDGDLARLLPEALLAPGVDAEDLDGVEAREQREEDAEEDDAEDGGAAARSLVHDPPLGSPR